jgi:hypothetical protein
LTWNISRNLSTKSWNVTNVLISSCAYHRATCHSKDSWNSTIIDCSRSVGESPCVPFGYAHGMVSSSIFRHRFVVIWETLDPFPTVADPRTAAEVSYPSKTPLSLISERTVPSVIASKESFEASLAALLISWETPIVGWGVQPGVAPPPAQGG